jgi:hypothetical protein
MIAIEAKITQPTLNKIIVGNVLTVELQINNILETSANIYSHQICSPKSSPGNMIISFVKKAKNSTVLAFVQ